MITHRSLSVVPMILAVCSMLCVSCATVFKGSTDTVTINTQPPGATIKINGTQRGMTPLSLELESNKQHAILLSKDGFQDETANISNSTAAGYVVLDILFIWWLVPIIVDAATGNWNTLDQQNINVILTPLKK